MSENLDLARTRARLMQVIAIAEQVGARRHIDVSAGGDVGVARTQIDTGESLNGVQSLTRDLSSVNTILQNLGPAVATLPASSPLESVRSSLLASQRRRAALESLINSPSGSSVRRDTESYGLGLNASYEVDLWGRIDADLQSAELDVAATEEDLYAAMQTVASQVVLIWLDIAQSREILELVEQQLETNRTVLDLIGLRYRRGLATALDVLQQRQIVAQTESAIPPLRAQIALLQNELAVLLGEPAAQALQVEAQRVPDIGHLPEYGVPADLLGRRPDVRSAGLRLRSADWSVSVARADRLPSLRLNAGYSFGAGDWDLVFDNWMASLAASIAGPVFDGGRRKAEVARAQAVVDERLAAYKLAVVSAIADVENALVVETQQREFIDALNRQLDAARGTYEEALARYRKGLNDYLPVLSALTSSQSLERSVVQAKRDLALNRVRLYVALGGAWMESELGD